MGPSGAHRNDEHRGVRSQTPAETDTLKPELSLPPTSFLGSMPEERAPSSVIEKPYERSYREILQKHSSYIPIEVFSTVHDKFGLTMLNTAALDTLEALSKEKGMGIVSIFSGLGYAEEQLRERGCDVVAFDRTISVKRWFLPLKIGSPAEMRLYGHRLLFMGFPDRGTAPLEALEAYLKGGGKTVAVATEPHEARHAFGADQAFFDKLATGKLLHEIKLNAWPVLETLQAARFGHSRFEPVVRVYRFE
jgi:hypothetical protein